MISYKSSLGLDFAFRLFQFWNVLVLFIVLCVADTEYALKFLSLDFDLILLGFQRVFFGGDANFYRVIIFLTFSSNPGG